MLLSERKWYRLNETNVARLPTTSGVYELSGAVTADGPGPVVFPRREPGRNPRLAGDAPLVPGALADRGRLLLHSRVPAWNRARRRRRDLADRDRDSGPGHVARRPPDLRAGR